jgi:hypothetical protein
MNFASTLQSNQNSDELGYLLLIAARSKVPFMAYVRTLLASLASLDSAAVLNMVTHPENR